MIGSRRCFSITTTGVSFPIEHRPNLKRKWWEYKRFRPRDRRKTLDEGSGSPILGVTKSRQRPLFLHRWAMPVHCPTKLLPVSLRTQTCDKVGRNRKPRVVNRDNWGWLRIPVFIRRSDADFIALRRRVQCKVGFGVSLGEGAAVLQVRKNRIKIVLMSQWRSSEPGNPKDSS